MLTSTSSAMRKGQIGMSEQSNDDWMDEWMGGFDIVIPIRAHVELRKKLAQLSEYKKDSERYGYLRDRDLDAIETGGVFAGMVPENVVLNGEDLDNAVDRALSHSNKDTNHER